MLKSFTGGIFGSNGSVAFRVERLLACEDCGLVIAEMTASESGNAVSRSRIREGCPGESVLLAKAKVWRSTVVSVFLGRRSENKYYTAVRDSRHSASRKNTQPRLKL